MDDFGKEHKCLAQQLKIWADQYGCILENKGGSMPSNHTHFVVTSQYSLEDIFWEDKPTLDALRRRFTIRHISERGKEHCTKRYDPHAERSEFFKPVDKKSE